MSDPITVYMAETSTRHYDFHAFGATEDEAVNALLAAWAAHADETGADPEHIIRDDINIISGQFGRAFRDGSLYPRNMPTPTRPKCAV